VLKEAYIRVVWLSYSLGHIDHSLTLTKDFSNLWKHCYRGAHASFHTVYNYMCLIPLSAVSLSRCISAKMSVFNSHMQGSHSVIWKKPTFHKEHIPALKTQKAWVTN